ncbi:chaperonin 10-like protein [Mycena vitilis]|nr:chaperonin 10-like protein [Mycena vitilis]
MSSQINLAVIVSSKEILVRVEAAGLNPVDPRIGGVYIPMWADLPTVPGAEAAGVVAAVGNDVKQFKVGYRVYVHSLAPPLVPPVRKRISSYQQYSLAHSAIVTKLPPNTSLEEGASIPVGLFTSLHVTPYSQPPTGAGLVSLASPRGRSRYAGQPIVILGATGHYALQLAKFSAFFPIIRTAHLKNQSHLKSLGATHIIDRSLPDTEVAKAVAALAPTLFVVFDTISTRDTLALWEKSLLQIIPTPMPEAAIEGVDVYMGWASSAWPQNNALSRELYSQLEGLSADGTIKAAPMQIEVVKGGLNIDVLEEPSKSFDKVSAAKRVVLPQETRV